MRTHASDMVIMRSTGAEPAWHTPIVPRQTPAAALVPNPDTGTFYAVELLPVCAMGTWQ